jgi:nitrous oxide reductase accessory protein NosL
MGMNLTAFAEDKAARKLAGERTGEVIQWEIVKQICKSHGHAKH